jgi:hypothetical protein
MRVHNAKVFDDYVPDATSFGNAVFTSETEIARLGQADQIAIHAIVDNIDGEGGTLNVQIEHSGDGRNWMTKNKDPEVTVTNLKKNVSNQDWGSDPNKNSNGQPLLTYVRLRIWFENKTKAGHVKVHVTQRDQAR